LLHMLLYDQPLFMSADVHAGPLFPSAFVVDPW